MVEGISNCNSYFDFCEHCLYGKQIPLIFPLGATRSKEIFELIHSNVFGPLPIS